MLCAQPKEMVAQGAAETLNIVSSTTLSLQYKPETLGIACLEFSLRELAKKSPPLVCCTPRFLSNKPLLPFCFFLSLGAGRDLSPVPAFCLDRRPYTRSLPTNNDMQLQWLCVTGASNHSSAT